MATYFAHSINQIDKDGVDIGDCLTAVLANLNDKAAILQALRDNLQVMNVLRDERITEAVEAKEAEKDSAIESAVAAAVVEKDAIIAAKQAEIDALTPPAQPTSVTQRQFRLALLGIGVDPDQVTLMIGGITDELQRQAAMIEWEYASDIYRTNPLVPQLAAALGKSDADVDALFAAAAAL